MKYYSDQNRTCFQYESGNYALTNGNRNWIGLVQSHDLSPNTNNISIRYLGGANRNVQDFAAGVQEWEGTFTYFPQDWKFLGFAIGSIQDVTGSHIFTETTGSSRVQTTLTSLTTFTIEDSKNIGIAGSNFIRTTIGGMVDSFTLNFAQGELVNCEVGYRAQASTLSSGAVVALAASTTKPYIFNNVKLHIPSGTLIDNLKTGTFSLTNNLEGGFYLNGSQTLSEIIPLNRDYELTGTCDMDTASAKTLYESYYVAGSTFNALIWCNGIAGSLSIMMSGCKMTDMPIPSVMEGRQEQSFTAIPSNVSAVAYDSVAKYNAW